MRRKASDCVFFVAVLIAARVAHALEGNYILHQIVTTVKCLVFLTC